MVNISECVDKCQIANEMLISSFKFQIKYLKNKIDQLTVLKLNFISSITKSTNKSSKKCTAGGEEVLRGEDVLGARVGPSATQCDSLRHPSRLSATPLATQCDSVRLSARLSATQCATHLHSPSHPLATSKRTLPSLLARNILKHKFWLV